MKKPNCFVIFCEFGAQRELESVRRLSKLAERLLPHACPAIVIVDNAINIDFEQKLTPLITKISGDNSNREFSAYDKGLMFLLRNFSISVNVPIIVANDTFYTNYGDEYLQRFSKKNVASTLAKGGIIGHIDAYPEPIQIFGLEIQKWIRSSFLITNLNILQKIGPFALPYKETSIFSEDIKEFFARDLDLSTNYKKYIRYWLFDKSPPAENFTQTWHSKTDLNENNFSNFKAKAKCILAEHFFSARAQAIKIPLVNV